LRSSTGRAGILANSGKELAPKAGASAGLATGRQ
jgi:hypothetical protein